MLGKWKVTSNQIDDKKYYRAYRLHDTADVDHSGNREYFGGYHEDREKAQSLVDVLNEE